MCVGCREMKAKKELIRIVKNKEGEINIDLKGKAPGRGAYVCYNSDCMSKVFKSKILEKTFEQRIDQEIYDRLMAQLAEEGESY